MSLHMISKDFSSKPTQPNRPIYMTETQHKPSSFKAGLLFSVISALLILTIIGAFFYENIFAWMTGVLYITYDTWLILYVAWKTRKLGTITDISEQSRGSENHRVEDNSIGVIVPIYNETEVILETIATLINQSYTPEKIIIVDDGSSDDGVKKLNAIYHFDNHSIIKPSSFLCQSNSHPNLYLLKKENSGKADSLNQALEILDCDIAVTVDADTALEPNAIAEIKIAFDKDSNMVTAGGILKPIAKGNVFAKCLGMFQFFEYSRAYLSRAAWGQSNALLLVSGAFAAYRREALMTVGCYDVNSLVEDYELIHRLHRYSADNNLGWTITTLPYAVGTTDAPSTPIAFIQQRKRWFAGFLRTHYQYRDMVGATRYNKIGSLMMPIKTLDTLQPIYGLVALYFLVMFAFTDQAISQYILIAILVKLSIDYIYHLWALRRYYKWLGLGVPKTHWLQATISCLTEPFFFQPLRHLSALVGWSIVMKKGARWSPIRTHSNN